MIDNSIWLAIIAAVPTVLIGVGLPIIMAKINNAQKNIEQQAAWDREDRKQLGQKFSDAQDVAADQRTKINDKLETIHHLCNGTVTTSMESELNALKREVGLRHQLEAHKRALKLGPSLDNVTAMDIAQRRINDLHMALANRALQAPEDSQAHRAFIENVRQPTPSPSLSPSSSVPPPPPAPPLPVAEVKDAPVPVKRARPVRRSHKKKGR